MANLTEIPHVNPPKPPPNPGGLGEKIYNLVVNTFVDIANVLFDPFAKMLQRSIENTFEGFEREAVEIFGPVVREVRKNEDLPDWVKRTLDETLAPTHPIQLAALLPLVGALVIAVPFARRLIPA